MANDAPPAPASPQPVTLDVSNAMALLGNDEDLYLQIAQAFHSELATVPAQLDALLHPRTDPTEAKRLLHTFKGLSLTVGAVALSEACRQAEAWLKASQGLGAEHDADALAALRQQLSAATDATLQALRPLLERLAPAPSTPQTAAGLQPAINAPLDSPLDAPFDAHLLVNDLRALELLLAASDMRAVDVHADIQKRHAAAGARLGALREAMHSFDFAQGVVQCQALIRTLSDNN